MYIHTTHIQCHCCVHIHIAHKFHECLCAHIHTSMYTDYLYYVQHTDYLHVHVHVCTIHVHWLPTCTCMYAQYSHVHWLPTYNVHMYSDYLLVRTMFTCTLTTYLYIHVRTMFTCTLPTCMYNVHMHTDHLHVLYVCNVHMYIHKLPTYIHVYTCIYVYTMFTCTLPTYMYMYIRTMFTCTVCHLLRGLEK